MSNNTRGIEWLRSAENKRYEERVVRPLLPFILASSAVAKAGVRIFEHDNQPIKTVPRALIPEEVYTIAKIGEATEARWFSQLLSRTMLDELPQLQAVMTGEYALVGPRGTLPEHRALLFDHLEDGRKVDHWRSILSAQRPGLLSTYALRAHEESATNGVVNFADEALARYEADAQDLTKASYGHSQELVTKWRQLIGTKVKGIIL